MAAANPPQTSQWLQFNRAMVLSMLYAPRLDMGAEMQQQLRPIDVAAGNVIEVFNETDTLRLPDDMIGIGGFRAPSRQ